MSHSKIFQISSKRIDNDDYASSSDFYDNSSDFADYIGDEEEDDDRRECIERLADTLEDLFTLGDDGESLVYKGEDAMKAFLAEWADAIRQKAQEVTAATVLDSMRRWELEKLCEETHLRTGYRVHIEEWNGGCAGPMDDLIEWVSDLKMKAGDVIYIGAVIDYHY